MHSAASLAVWNTLDAMAANFVVEAVAAVTINLEANELEGRALTQSVRADVSALGTGK